MDRHFGTFQSVYDELFAPKYGGAPTRVARPVVERSVTAFVRCGDLYEGFARVRCPDCRDDLRQICCLIDLISSHRGLA